ncbi:hypothetical protein BV22DRAFT_206300 [Leucogyrophana mollusca]|uniref:Uncharacterized protein n=1 Tax=Leucogyrophana mollusca TaxID=85980 RepID=A0ACB8BSB0_9AGAM|nr:hypothetical protein BV22DRAFT_206300 [Leucogyrophana mollusca]
MPIQWRTATHLSPRADLLARLPPDIGYTRPGAAWLFGDMIICKLWPVRAACGAPVRVQNQNHTRDVRLRSDTPAPGHARPIPVRGANTNNLKTQTSRKPRTRANSTNSFEMPTRVLFAAPRTAPSFPSPASLSLFSWSSPPTSPAEPPDARFALKGPISAPTYGADARPASASAARSPSLRPAAPEAASEGPTAAQCDFSATLNVHGGLDASRRRHHPFHRRKVPYPRSYERAVVDLDVWDTLWCRQTCGSVTWHVFDEERPPRKVLDIGCGASCLTAAPALPALTSA